MMKEQALKARLNKVNRENKSLKTRVQELEEICKIANKFINGLYTDDNSLGGFIMSKKLYLKFKKLEKSLNKFHKDY
jgi:hypothetical protein